MNALINFYLFYHFFAIFPVLDRCLWNPYFRPFWRPPFFGSFFVLSQIKSFVSIFFLNFFSTIPNFFRFFRNPLKFDGNYWKFVQKNTPLFTRRTPKMADFLKKGQNRVFPYEREQNGLSLKGHRIVDYLGSAGPLKGVFAHMSASRKGSKMAILALWEVSGALRGTPSGFSASS